jgi:hypothetical protein
MDFREVTKLTDQIIQEAKGLEGNDLKVSIASCLAKAFNVTPTHSYNVSFRFSTLDDKQAVQYRITKVLQSLAESTHEAVGSVTIAQEL